MHILKHRMVMKTLTTLKGSIRGFTIFLLHRERSPKHVCRWSRTIKCRSCTTRLAHIRCSLSGTYHMQHVCWLLARLTSQQHASVSQVRIYSDKFTCCHTEIEVADQTFHLTQSQYTDTGPTSPSTDPITPGAWQGIHWSANF